MYSIPKPHTWPTLPLFTKISYYKEFLSERHANYVDKIEAKIIVKEMLGDIHVSPIVRILDNPEDFHESDLNTNHIVKAAHGCGWNISINEDTTVEYVKGKLKEWNHTYRSTDEKQYAFLKPRFFIEEKIVDSVLGLTDSAIVYCIRCIHGKPFVIGVRRAEGQNNYDLDWNPVKIEIGELEKPKELEKMLEIAEILSEPFEFVRVDLYIGAGQKIYFSEFTFTPSGGRKFYSMKDELRYGALWT